MAKKHKMSGVRVLALADLSTRGDKFFRPVAQKIIDGYGGGRDGGQAFVVGSAIQMLAKSGKGNDVDSLIRVVESALSSGAWARREGNNVPDILAANIRNVFLVLVALIRCDETLLPLLSLITDEFGT